MNKSMKTLFASSIVAVVLAGAVVPASAAENTMPMSNQQMMMQGQAQGGGMPAAMPGYGPGGGGMGMMGAGYGHGYGMQRGMGAGMMGGNMAGGGCPMGMMGNGMGQGYGMGGFGFGSGAGMMMGPGMMGGGGMMGGVGQGMMGRMAMFDLSDAQMEQMEKIQAEAMKKQRKLMRQMWDEQEKMSDLYDAENRDPAAIGKAYGKLSDLKRQAIEVHIDTENKAAAILTKEQKTQMRRGFGRGMMGY